MFIGIKNQILFLTLILKVCYTTADTKPTTAATYEQAKPASNADNSSVTSYFRHDPYGPNTYAFGYEINDKNTNNVQFRDERRHANGTVQGSYGYVRPDGRITITHYRSDKEFGYLAHTDTFEAGEQHKWEEHWPSKEQATTRPDNEMIMHNVSYDDKQHLNVTTGVIKPAVAQGLKEQYGINVPQKQTQKEKEQEQPEINPTLMDIVNGKIPLTGGGKNNKTLGFETVQNYIPPNFPITPFELPAKLQDQKNDAKKKKVEVNKYNKAKVNNAEKSMEVETLKKTLDSVVKNETKADSDNVAPKLNTTQASTQLPTVPLVQEVDNNLPKPLIAASSGENVGSADWYQQVINDARKDFLQNVPNLK